MYISRSCCSAGVHTKTTKNSAVSYSCHQLHIHTVDAVTYKDGNVIGSDTTEHGYIP